METSEKVPIFAWIVREGGLPVPLHRSPLQDQLGLQGFVYSLCGAPQAVRRFFRFFHSDVSVSHFAVEVFHRIADIERRRDGERVLVDVVTRVVLGDAGIRFVRIA